MKNNKRTVAARIAVAVIGVIAAACVAVLLGAPPKDGASERPAPAEVSRDLLDLVVDPERQEIQTDYVYRFNIWSGGVQMLPEVKTVEIPQKYRVLFRIHYDDGSQDYAWEEISRQEYAELIGEGGKPHG